MGFVTASPSTDASTVGRPVDGRRDIRGSAVHAGWMNSRTALAHGHGVVSFATLRSALAHAEIRRLISAGQLRPARGWYAAPWADKTVVAAVASGGVQLCQRSSWPGCGCRT